MRGPAPSGPGRAPGARAQGTCFKDPAEIRLEELRTRMRGLMKELDPAAARLASMLDD